MPRGTLLGLSMFAALLGCRESDSEFVRAHVAVMPAGPASSRRPASIEVADPVEATRVAALFPELGRGLSSSVAGGWMAEIRITFEGKKGEKLIVQIDPDLKYWSEGEGDWPLNPKFKQYLEELLAHAEKGEKPASQ